jgi:hypothetical protein
MRFVGEFTRASGPGFPTAGNPIFLVIGRDDDGNHRLFPELGLLTSCPFDGGRKRAAR